MQQSANPTERMDAATGAERAERDAVDLLKLILDEERLTILGMVAAKPCTASEVADALPGKRTPPAKHLAQLFEAGLLTQVGEDRYALNVRRLQQWKRELFARPAAPTPESTDEQILATFVRNGKMVQYPAQHTKRLVLLRWLASPFEVGRDYSEREVNEMLSGHSEDHATLRRFLVDAQLLTRNEGIYRRA